MGLFHCPVGAPFYDDEACIDCKLCMATTREEMVEATKRIRAHAGSGIKKKGTVSKIAVTGKGGVGKSSVVTLLAAALERKGYRVVVLDADESNTGLHRMIGFEGEPKYLMASTKRPGPGEEEPSPEWMTNDRIGIADLPAEYVLSRDGLRFLIAGKIVDPLQGCACRIADTVGNLIARFTVGDDEVMIIDTEAGVESFGRGVERSVDTVLIVAEPSFESLVLSEKIAYMAEGIGIGMVRAVLNKVPSDEIRQKMAEELSRRNVKVAGTIYLDPELSEAAFKGVKLGYSKAASDMDAIVAVLLEESR